MADHDPRPRILATDLDGTLIPLDGDPQNASDLRILAEELARSGVSLVFVSGRHLASIEHAMEHHALPPPDWIVADVGTSIYRRRPDGAPELLEPYQAHLDRRVRRLSAPALDEALGPLRGLVRQEPEKQGRFKLSFYTDAGRLAERAATVRHALEVIEAPYSIIESIDPFNGDGLIDLLPEGVSKAHALEWWVDYDAEDREHVVFAGDSGNDLAALTAGYLAIVVANARPEVIEAARRAHAEAGWERRLYIAKARATSGLLEGCRWFGMFGGPS